ncbi:MULTISPECIES: hypothetical protein [Streptomyces]|uniref:DUF6891 domain-containing protein n=1 Tax=Streptomyces koelreuteriae TaxID=2838015 RepID=A0ABX8FXU3_9ACTN|nr:MULTISPECIES: hypothetical protein [Streptomyces]QWB26050.1 hypothetical protein KJK29_27770 [Streptomyces koelreuteriae]UUA09124.1 hypothetical protein NNW98_27935 [Streptomyces koelreuteriae]UUA16729.1 hypothetical protein NNW99_27820 [Streptomyces sp. CRCS-T-1]
MENDGGLTVKVRTESGQAYTRIAARELRELVERIGGDDDHFLIVQRIPDRPMVFIQTARDGDGAYDLQHRTGSVPHLWVTRLTDPGLVAEVMVRWARQEDGWDTGVTWEREKFGLPAAPPPLAPEVSARAEGYVHEMLRDGYLDIETMIREAVYLMQGKEDSSPVSPAQARQIVERLWLERVDEQETWSEPTDPDRLERAFAALDRGGIVAREDFTCCRGCGMAEIGAEADGTPGVRGFVFFHHQCTRGAARGHGLSLYYGGFDGSEETTKAVGHEVVAALAAAGLSTEWDGDPGKAIDVGPLEWRKRLVG